MPKHVSEMTTEEYAKARADIRAGRAPAYVPESTTVAAPEAEIKTTSYTGTTPPKPTDGKRKHASEMTPEERANGLANIKRGILPGYWG